MYDFLVVGAGIAGASAAYELSTSARVCLLEAEERPGLHATGRSAALYDPSYGGREIRALTRASRAFFDAPPEGFNQAPLLTERGCLYIAGPDQTWSLTAMAAEVEATGGHLAPMDRAEALARVDRLRPDYLAAATYDAEAMDIDVDALHQGFLRGARARGAALIVEAAVRAPVRRDGLWRVATAQGEVTAPVLVNAAGAWADEVAEACGAGRLGLTPMRRTALLVDPPPGADIRGWPMVIDADEAFYFKPDAGKLLLSPADETPQPPGDAQPEELDIAIAVDRVQQALDIEVRRVSHSWAGLRTFAPDRKPVVGFDAATPGLFWCAGQGGYGIQTAPAMGRLVAALARGEAAPADITAEGVAAERLSPRRFAVA